MNWKQVIEHFYSVAYDPDEFVLAMNPPATTSQILSLEETLGFTFPQEWHDLYATTNGFGVAGKDEPDSAMNLFPTLADLPALVAASREAIAHTHPAEADQYIPVLDYINGDTIGYRLDDPSCRLHMLNHEAMAYDSEQDVEDFLYPIVADSLQSFLMPSHTNGNG